MRTWKGLAALLAAAACGTGERRAVLEVDAVTDGAPPARVVLRATGTADDGSAVAIEAPAAAVGQRYRATVAALPPGTYTFAADAYGADDTVVAAVPATDAQRLGTGQSALALVVAAPKKGGGNHAPVITSAFQSALEIAGNEAVHLAVTVTDADLPGDALTSAWSDGNAGGTFSAPDALSTTWTPGARASGKVTLSFKVTDRLGASAGIDLAVKLKKPGPGSANVTFELNHWPVVRQVNLANAQLTPGQQGVPIAATAADPDGDALAYAWSGVCAGFSISGAPGAPLTFRSAPVAFADAARAATTFDVPPWSGVCRLTIDVSDGRGGTNTGDVFALVTPPVVAEAPQVDVAFMAPRTARPGVTARFAVQAHDPQGGAVSYGWCVWDPARAACSAALPGAVSIADAGRVLGSQVDVAVPPCRAGASGTTRTFSVAAVLRTVAVADPTIFPFDLPVTCP